MFLEKYYTDMHDVDEDLRTIMSYGGDCGLYWGDMKSGVFLHAMYDSSTSTVDNVASKKNNIQPPSKTGRLCNVLYYNFT